MALWWSALPDRRDILYAWAENTSIYDPVRGLPAGFKTYVEGFEERRRSQDPTGGTPAILSNPCSSATVNLCQNSPLTQAN